MGDFMASQTTVNGKTRQLAVRFPLELLDEIEAWRSKHLVSDLDGQPVPLSRAIVFLTRRGFETVKQRKKGART